MYNYKKITDDLYWVGANDRRLAMFEGVYSVPDGVSYNSYLLLDEKTVLMDTVDKAVTEQFLENVEAVLGQRELDYLVIHHMEPDHAASIQHLIRRYPGVQIVCNNKIAAMLGQFFTFDVASRSHLVKEGDTLCTGRHTLTFVMAPMVHWPEVMVTYDTTDQLLFSADAFGAFGALNGAMFADEVDFARDYMDEARRYYTNIVGKYGNQVQALLKKVSALDIRMICPLHGFVWRKNLGDFIDKYVHWASYTPEVQGVAIAYASVYGHTENAAEILSSKLRDRGIVTKMFDVSVTPASDIISACFQYSHLVFASTTYNAGIFVNMEALIYDLVAHNIQNRTVALIENGSWAPTSGGLMRRELEKCKNITFLDNMVTIRSALKEAQLAELDAMADAIAATLSPVEPDEAEQTPAKMEMKALHKLSYGLFVLSARQGGKDNGCIINTATQVGDTPKRISISVNKANHTHDMILATGAFNLSLLSTDADFSIFKRFGFQSGRDVDKFQGLEGVARSANGLTYVTGCTNAVLSGKVITTVDCGSHTLFVADLTEAIVLDGVPSMTYQYYFDHVKPKPQAAGEEKKGWVCEICGYVYEGETLPADYVCPLCKHGPADFKKLG